MAVLDDVSKISKKLQKMVSRGHVDAERTIAMLKVLQDLPITLNILTMSKIGVAVNAMRKMTDDDEVLAQARLLIKAWKKLLPAAQQQQQQDRGELSRSSREASEIDEDSRDSVTATGADISYVRSRSPSPTTGPHSPAEATTRTSGGSPDQTNNSPAHVQLEQESPPVEGGCDDVLTTRIPESLVTDDPVRLKCREMLVSALKTLPQPEKNDMIASFEVLAAQLEDCIFTEFVNTDTKYKNRIRSRHANLRDAKNPALRHKFLAGDIDEVRMARMSAEEMASDDVKKMRQKFHEESINDHQMAKNEGTKTDLLKCKRCRQNNCSYSQMQTRSADEPMTTFCFCNACGFRWKFC